MKCDPGDLAVILPGALPENVGAFVTVMHPFDMHPQLGMVWWVRGRTPLKTSCGLMVMEGVICESFLNPIRPPKPDQQSTTKTSKPEVTPA